MSPAALRKWLVIGLVVLVLGIAAFVLTARATDASSFCPRCHEMGPYYTAWTQGGHGSDAQCVDCHVDAGFVPRLAHKFVALGEVWSHFFGNKTFPLAAPASVPDSRCVRCHPKVTVKSLPASFSHDTHAKQGPCEMCHPTAGHDVTTQALQAAGIYNPANAALRAQAGSSAPAAPGAGKANLAGHVAVACSQCHDMKATPCSSCHTPDHEPRGECSQCHKPGEKFSFAHPSTRMPGWQKIACKKCHPVSYTAVNCTCHKGGVPSED